MPTALARCSSPSAPRRCLFSFICGGGATELISSLCQCSQVLTNLLSNAIKFAAKEHGGAFSGSLRSSPTLYRRTVRRRHAPLSRADYTVRYVSAVVTMTTDVLPDGLLRVRVHDNGRGMSPEGVQRIFRPWMQAEEETKANYGGTGEPSSPPHSATLRRLLRSVYTSFAPSACSAGDVCFSADFFAQALGSSSPAISPWRWGEGSPSRARA